MRIVQERARHLNDQKTKLIILQESKKVMWSKMQDSAATRVRAQTLTDHVNRDLEERRATNVFSMERGRRLRFAGELVERKKESMLKAKRFANRMADVKGKKQKERVFKLIEKFNARKDWEKTDLIRNRNVEIRMEARDRKLKEARWRKERLALSAVSLTLEPATDGIGTLPEVTKTFKSGSSIVFKSEDEDVAKERSEFLERVDRDERILEKMRMKDSMEAGKKGSAQLEIERIQRWRQAELDKREALTNLKLANEAERRDAARAARELEVSKFHKIKHLEELRMQKWRVAESQSNSATVARANGCVGLVHQLIPCLTL